MIIYIEYVETDDSGEVEGVFTEDGKCLGIWSSNDGNWRHEYFNGFLKELGIEVKSGKFEEKLEEEAQQLWG